jgi:hypothetical protein
VIPISVCQHMGMIVYDALILCGILYVIGRHEADYSFGKSAVVAGTLSVLSIALNLVLIVHMSFRLLLIVVPVVMLPVSVWLVAKYCWLSWPKAVLAVVLFYMAHSALVAVVGTTRDDIFEPMTGTGTGEAMECRLLLRPLNRACPKRSFRTGVFGVQCSATYSNDRS